MIIQTDNRQYARDTRNHALLTTDAHALARARAQRAAAKRQRETQDELISLREQVATLKALIDKLGIP